jgi:tight adherence protein B
LSIFSFPFYLISQPSKEQLSEEQSSLDQISKEQSFDENRNQETGSFSSNDMIVKEVDVAGFPNISVYINFREDSRLGSLELNNNNFIILENESTVKDFEVKKVGEISEPIGVVLVLDTSGSMRGKPINDAIKAAVTFIDEMRDIDKIAIVGFADEVTTYSSFTSNKEQLKSSIDDLSAIGETSLFDGILEGLGLFANTDYLKHKYIVVLSDGTDTVSKSSVYEIISKAKSMSITVFSIALLSGEFNPEDIQNISESTGGELLQTTNSKDLVSFYSNVSKRIKNQYKLSYRSLFQNEQRFNLQIFVEESGIKDSIIVYYENPFQTVGGSAVISNTQDSQSIANIMIIDVWWMKLIIYVFIFVSVTMFIYIGSTIMVPGKQDLKSRTDLYLYNVSYKNLLLESEEKKKKSSFSIKFSNFISRVFARRGFAELFEQKLKRAGTNISGSKFVAFHIISVVIVTLVVFLLTKNFLITLPVVLFIILSPFLIINFKTGQRIKKFNEQLPDTLQLVEGALKAGYSLNQSLGMVINETKPPISDEFRMTMNEIRMGLPEKDALDNMAKRINSELFNWVVLAVNIQRDVGGNLAEIMDIIANTIREKDRVLRQIKALIAEGKLSAYVLIGLPIILGVVLSILNREYISVLFTTKIGILMIFLAAGLMIAGILWIMRIIKIDY